MKQLGALFGVIVCSMLLLNIQPARAETQQVFGGQIKVQAQVRPVHYITVNKQGIITEIASNTDGPAEARVFLDDVTLNIEQPLSDKVAAQYQALVPGGVGQIGVLYRHGPFLPVFNAPNKLQSPFPL
jgi:hypothetical protein